MAVQGKIVVNQPSSGGSSSTAHAQPVAPGPSAVEIAEFNLAGVIGAELSEPLQQMQRIVQEFTRSRKVSGANMRQLQVCIDSARRVAMQSQQIARLATGKLRQSHERLSLDAILNQALDERVSEFQSLGIEVYRSIKTVDVIVDPGLLYSLVGAAIDWASGHGQRLVVSLELQNWPEHGLLHIKSSQSVAVDSDYPHEQTSNDDKLSWYLLQQIAQTMGVLVEHESSAHEVSVLLEFPRTVRQLEGLTAIELDAGGHSTLQGETKTMAGLSILLVTNEDMLRAEVALICRPMGLVMDCVPNSLQAERFCERHDAPHMLILDERAHDARIDQLRVDLQRSEPNLPMLEIVQSPNTLEMASWLSGSMTRVSRGSLRAQLPSIMLLELARVI